MESSIAYADRLLALPPVNPPLDIAVAHARDVLDQALAVDMELADSFTVARELGGVCESLRQVLAAFDAEAGRHA
ncbi:hypothetical protein ABZX56_10925 [Streptomyces parvulus]|uniref:hypothetical protein n=1 Tax=Streptomyces parvulus TaxID=146923 RepID=UPI0033A2D8F8